MRLELADSHPVVAGVIGWILLGPGGAGATFLPDEDYQLKKSPKEIAEDFVEEARNFDPADYPDLWAPISAPMPVGR